MKPASILIAVIYSLLANLAAAKAPGQPQQTIKLSEVLASINSHYPQVKMALLEINRAQGALISAKGKFDPALGASSRSQPMGGYINNYADTELAIPTLYNGVKLFAGYRNGQGDWPIYYQNYLTNSGGEYRAGLSFPLLRDRAIDKERTDLLSSQELIRMREQEAEAIKIKIYQEAIKVYWQWVEAGLQLKIFEDLLQLAETRQQAIKKQAELGDLPQLAIIENSQQIVQRKQLLNQGRMLFEQASINLSLYYRDNTSHPIVLSTKNLPKLSPLSHHYRIKAIAINDHPALKKLNNYSNVLRLKRNQARNELLPQLDATAYTSKQYGSGGYPRMLPQAAMLGASFKFPLLQRQAKGNLIQAESELRLNRVEKKFLQDQLRNEMRNILIGIKRSLQQVKLFSKELLLAKQVQGGEAEKFRQGDSTLFLVNQREQLSTQVQLNYLHAEIDLEALQARLRFFTSSQLG